LGTSGDSGLCDEINYFLFNLLHRIYFILLIFYMYIIFYMCIFYVA